MNASGLNSVNALKSLFYQCFKFSPLRVILAFLLMLASSAASGVGILLIVPLMASVGVNVGGFSTSSGITQAINKITTSLGISLDLASILLLYLLLIILVATIGFANTVISSSLRQSFVVYLRNKLARSLFFAQWNYLNNARMSDFVRLITSQVQSVSASLFLLMSLVNGVILVAVYLGFCMLLSPALTLIALICGLALAVLLWPINKRIHSSGSIGLKANQDIYRSIFENVTSLKIIKSFAAEERYLQTMSVSNAIMEKQQIRMAKFNALTRFVNTIGAAIIFTLLFYSAIKWLNLEIANLIIILLIFSRLMPQISSMQSTAQNLIHQAPTYQNLVQHSRDLEHWAEPSYLRAQAPKFEQKIVLKDLCYRYSDNDNQVLDKLNAKININSTVAIVGPSGAGKSTLADLIAGLLEPESGQILIDGKELNKSNRLAWRGSVAYVTQEVFLFHESVKENLLWVCQPDQFESETHKDYCLWQALEMAAADEFVRNLPNGLDTFIGDRGVKLSGGQRQRLALARALLAKPDVLIMDEATSSLDSVNEKRVRDALLNLRGQLTIIVIAHNETTIEHVTHRICL